MSTDSRRSTPLDVVLQYHEETKHQFHAYARGPESLDWASQPDPFRVYTGAPRVDLPLSVESIPALFDDLVEPARIPSAPLSDRSIGQLFELALGLSAWKQFGSSKWALRCNPSSGNLHPTEGYLLCGALAAGEPDHKGRGGQGVPAGLHHYVSRDHALEGRAALDATGASVLEHALPPDAVLVGLTSVHWREAWKYGERAFRYCQHDVGHALGSIRYAAACLGWQAWMVEPLADAALRSLLGLDRADQGHLDEGDHEHPDALVLVVPSSADRAIAMGRLLQTVSSLSTAMRGATWTGRANALSKNHVAWQLIIEVAAAAERPSDAGGDQLDTVSTALRREGRSRLPRASSDVKAEALIRKRRSAVSLDRVTSLDAIDFFRILERLLPLPGVPPWDIWPWQPHVHVLLFVHRVRGLPPGLYFLERRTGIADRLRNLSTEGHDWVREAAAVDHIPLYRLAATDTGRAAQAVSCHQEIAADGAFSLGMIAEFSDTISARGAWWYRRLFWEAGLLGQVLYLEAERAGVRGTGIGCFFDDAVHQILGLPDRQFQSLYHFTVGGPVEDTRLVTHPPYAHL